MDDSNVCPQCGAEYDAPGLCETCQVPLKEGDEDDELEGFQTDDEDADDDLSEEEFATDGDEEEYGNGESNAYAGDSYEDQDNY